MSRSSSSPFFMQREPIPFAGGNVDSRLRGNDDKNLRGNDDEKRPLSVYSGEGLAYRWYDPDRMVLGKRMQDQLRVAVCYWHSFGWPGTDPFGGDTFRRRWHAGGDAMAQARNKADVAFEMFRLLGVPFFTFHDRDIAPEGATLAESNRNVRAIGAMT